MDEKYSHKEHVTITSTKANVINSPLMVPFERFEKDWNSAHCFVNTAKLEYKHKYDDVMKSFCKAVFTSIENFETIHPCGVMIAIIYNEQECVNTICKTISNALTSDKSKDKRAVYKAQWLKEHFVKNSSIILAIPLKDSAKYSMRNNNKKNNNNNDSTILYDVVIEQVISVEMKKLQQVLKTELEKEIESNSELWQGIQAYDKSWNTPDISHTSEASTNDHDTKEKETLLLNHAESEYKEYSKNNEMKKDLESKNLEFIYENDIVLTEILIKAQSMNQLFQSQCKLIFDDKLFSDLNGKFQRAPVKSRQRCQLKSILEYSDEGRSWPYCCNILDYLRCSVCFESFDGLLKGLYFFEQLVKRLGDKLIIKRVLRVKNGFKTIDCNNIDTVNYADIKLNVLVEYFGQSMVTEIQFLTQIMLNFKKLSEKKTSHFFSSLVFNFLVLVSHSTMFCSILASYF